MKLLMNLMKRQWWPAFMVLILLTMSAPAIGQEPDEDFGDFSELALEDLLNMTVISASKIEQLWTEAPNAIWIITAEDIRRSGARTIPDALRLAPGVYVAQLTGNRWVVTIGGFALNDYANKILVLIDGVSVYSPLTGGVDWNLLPVNIQEIERIEVIRGPGGVTFGANAVNGVVNIITRSPESDAKNFIKMDAGTQGVYSTDAGASFATKDGKVLGRIAAGYDESGGLGNKQGDEYSDTSSQFFGSGRLTFLVSESIRLNLDARHRGGHYEQAALQTNADDSMRELNASILRMRIDQEFNSGGNWYFQAFYNRNLIREQNEDDGDWEAHIDTIVGDVEFQNMIPFEALGGHRLTWGGGYRWVETDFIWLEGRKKDYTVANIFLHDEWSPHETVRFNAGIKYEDISLIDPTWQWRVALLFLPVPEHSFRVAVSDSYRSPTVSEQYMRIVVPLPDGLGFLAPFWPPGEDLNIVTVDGEENLEPEHVTSYEFGYRGIFFERVNVDLSYAYKEYENLISLSKYDDGFFVTVPPPPPMPPIGPFGIGMTYTDDGRAISHTVEAGIDARITNQVRALVNYGYVDLEVSGDNVNEAFEETSPRHFGRAGVSYTHPQGFMADLGARYVDEVKIYNNQNPDDFDPETIDDYWAMDFRIAQRFDMKNGELEVGAVGKNILPCNNWNKDDEWHDEYHDMNSIGNPDFSPMEVRTSYYGYVEYRFQ